MVAAWRSIEGCNGDDESIMSTGVFGSVCDVVEFVVCGDDVSATNEPPAGCRVVEYKLLRLSSSLSLLSAGRCRHGGGRVGNSHAHDAYGIRHTITHAGAVVVV